MGGSPGDVSEEPMTLEKRQKGWRMRCDVGKATERLIMSCDVSEVAERLENELCCDYNFELCSDYNYELCSFSNLSVTSLTSQLILQLFRRFTYVTANSPAFLLIYTCPAHSPTLLSLLLRNRLFTYVTWRAGHEAPF